MFLTNSTFVFQKLTTKIMCILLVLLHSVACASLLKYCIEDENVHII